MSFGKLCSSVLYRTKYTAPSRLTLRKGLPTGWSRQVLAGGGGGALKELARLWCPPSGTTHNSRCTLPHPTSIHPTDTDTISQGYDPNLAKAQIYTYNIFILSPSHKSTFVDFKWYHVCILEWYLYYISYLATHVY